MAIECGVVAQYLPDYKVLKRTICGQISFPGSRFAARDYTECLGPSSQAGRLTIAAGMSASVASNGTSGNTTAAVGASYG